MARIVKLVLAAVLLALVAYPLGAHANSTYRNAWKAAYPNACSTLLTAVSSCSLCHAASGVPDLNPYGSALVGHSANITSTNNLDSDGDGRTNIQEIGDCTLPGDPTSALPAESTTWGQIKSIY